MNTIFLKQLTLKNFKGIKNLTIDFSNLTNIYGENGTGKTTIQDAFLWLLFDKDSTNRKDFEIKTLDHNNNVMHNLEHSVTANLQVDDKTKVFSKTYKEVWTKKRNEAEKLLTTHETIYLIDDVPFKKSEYQDFVNSLIDENIFKIITNPFYFSNVLKWEERRNILIDFADDIDVPISDYLQQLLTDKTEKQLKDSLNFKKKKFNEELKLIPARIDEVSNSIVLIDASKIKEKESFENRLKHINDSLYSFSDSFQGEKQILSAKRQELSNLDYTLKSKRFATLSDLKERLNNYKSDLQGEYNTLSLEQNTLNRLNAENLELDEDMQKLKIDFRLRKDEEFIFDESLSICPTCKQSLPTQDIEDTKTKLLGNFNLDKANNLSRINAKGKQLKEIKDKNEIAILEAQKSVNESNIAILETQNAIDLIEKEISIIESHDTSFADSYEMNILKSEIAELESKLQNTDLETQKIEMLKQKDFIENSLDEIKRIENNVNLNKERNQRISELSEQEIDIANQIGSIEKGLFELERYTMAKAEALESNINSKFNFVKFKLFDTQMNEGIKETCVALINGVPFADANNAAKYNSGIDIINTLSNYYKVSAPIFIDNREGINKLIDTNSQIINLIVSKDKELIIRN